VLDAGCGTGVVTRDLGQWVGADGRAVGVDPSRAFVREARRRARLDGAGAPIFRVGDGRGLPFRAASFDATVPSPCSSTCPRATGFSRRWSG